MLSAFALPAQVRSIYGRFNSQKKSVKILLVFAILLLLVNVIHVQLTVSGNFVILPVQNADVRAEVEGIIATIYHEEGENIEKGMPIASLSDRDIRADLEKVKAQIDEKNAQLKLLEAGARPEEITLAKTVVEKTNERLKYARKDLEMDRALMEKEIISAKQFAQSEGLVALREKESQEAKDQLKILLAGSRKEEIDATKAGLGSLQAQERFLDGQLKSLTIVSPISGIVATHKLREKIGQNVNKGDLIAKVYELKTVEAEIAIPEKEFADIRMGQRVLLKAQAFPQEDFDGTVTSIAPIAAKQADRGDERSITVVTRLENSSMLLKPEMSGNAKIYCGEQRLINIIARRFVRFFRVEFWSWW